MRSFWFDPYLWVHLAGIAALPLFLELCLLGLSIGEPLFPAWFELLFVGAIGILPALWMQWQRPFSIFSLVLLALKPSHLTDDQRRILQRFKTPLHRILAVLSALVMVGVLWQLYQIAPRVSPPLVANISRGAALVIASIAFLGSNLFLQVPVSVLSVLLTRDNTFATTPPYEAERIAQSFTIPGIRVAKILPPLLRSLPPTPTAPPPDPIARSAPPAPPPAAAPSLETPPALPVPPPLLPIAAEIPEAESGHALENALKNAADGEFSSEFDDEFSNESNSEFDDEPDALDRAITEEVEILADLASAETAAIDPVENQTRDAIALTDLEHETMAAVTQPASQPALKPSKLTQLEESSELTEEIIVPPIIVSPTPPAASVERATSLEILPDAIEPEPNAAVIDAEQTQPAKNLSATRTIPNSIDSPPTPSVEIVEDAIVEDAIVEDAIVEDATVVETFNTDNADDHADDQNKDDRQPETNPEISKSDTDEKEPQQETEPSDPWE